MDPQDNQNSGNYKVANKTDLMLEKKMGVQDFESRQLLLETCIFRPHMLTC